MRLCNPPCPEHTASHSRRLAPNVGTESPGYCFQRLSRGALDPLLTLGVNELEVTGSLLTVEEFRGSDKSGRLTRLVGGSQPPEQEGGSTALVNRCDVPDLTVSFPVKETG